MAFPMYTTFGEVLQEVLVGLPITEPNRNVGRIRRRCPETKRVPRRSGFALGCHAQTIRKRERQTDRQTERKTERERKRNKKHNITTQNKIEKKGYVCMKDA